MIILRNTEKDRAIHNRLARMQIERVEMLKTSNNY